MDECIFCNIVQGKIPSYTVYSDEKFIAILDINPANPGHTILFPKAHFKSVMEMDENTHARFFIIARALALALLEFGAEGVNYIHSMGEVAGQRIPHVMIHIAPRYKNDNVYPFYYEPKRMEKEKFEEIKQRISALLKAPPSTQPVQKIESEKKEAPQIYKLPPRTGRYW